MSTPIGEFWNACERAKANPFLPAETKQAIFSEHFVPADAHRSPQYARVAVAALLGTLRLEWSRER